MISSKEKIEIFIMVILMSSLLVLNLAVREAWEDMSVRMPLPYTAEERMLEL